jgi:hypothetical protein
MNEFANPSVKFYRHSGKTPLLGLLLLGVTGCVGVPILGLLYGVLMRVIPFVYLNAFIVFGYIFVIGAVLGYVAKYGKIRNMVVLGVIAFFIGLLAEYSGWIGWLAVMVRDPMFLIEFFFPFEVFYLISLVAEEGAWTLSGMTPTGGFLYFIWLLEAVAVVGGITYIAVTDNKKVPFCEESDRWADKRTQIGAFTPIPNIAQFKQSVKHGNLSVFNRLRPSPAEDRHFTTLELYECGHCRNFFVLNVEDVTLVTNNKGKTEAKVKPILSNLMITPFQLENLKRLAEPDMAQTDRTGMSQPIPL